VNDAYPARKARDRSNVAMEIEFEILIERRVPGVGRSSEEQRVAVRRRSHHRFRREIAAGARPILDDERLTETFREPLADQARIGVVDAARRKSGNDAHRPVREGLRPREGRRGRKRGRARGDMEKSTAGKFHGSPLALPRETPADSSDTTHREFWEFGTSGGQACGQKLSRSPCRGKGLRFPLMSARTSVPAALGPEQTPYEGPT
jgi:hypothetical protein